MSSLLLILLTGCAVNGDSGEQPPFEIAPRTLPAAALSQQLAERADQVEQLVVGTVVDIEYLAPDEVWPAARAAVTWTVDPDHREADAETLTLRFGGGPVANGRLMRMADIPLFNLGERDLLLVSSADGDPYCPLLGCTAGLIRLVDGGAYTARGGALALDEEGSLRAGPTEHLPELTTFDVAGMVLSFKGSDHPDLPRPAAPLSEGELIHHVTAALGGNR